VAEKPELLELSKLRQQQHLPTINLSISLQALLQLSTQQRSTFKTQPGTSMQRQLTIGSSIGLQK
jgi:hypothetical protein